MKNIIRINWFNAGFVLALFLIICPVRAEVITEGGRTYIVDLRGERWDVTQATGMGFKPELFRHGIGRDAFRTLDDTHLTRSHGDFRGDSRVIGIATDKEARAYSVSKLARHEIANSFLGSEGVAVGY